MAANGKGELGESPGVWPICGAASRCTEGGFHPAASVHPRTPHMGMGKGCLERDPQSLDPTAMAKGRVRSL